MGSRELTAGVAEETQVCLVVGEGAPVDEARVVPRLPHVHVHGVVLGGGGFEGV